MHTPIVIEITISCHYGKTPPCSQSLIMAGVNRIVVGFRDPNPRVDGGGIKQLKKSGLDVQIIRQSGGSKDEEEVARECANLVEHFVKRISGDRKYPDEMMNGKKRRALRGIAGRQKTEGTIRKVEWPVSSEDKKDSKFAEEVSISHRYLETVDGALWDHEIVLLRFSIMQKKKGAKILGERIADVLDAHVVQVMGHTVLLYRPGFPPIIDLDELTKTVDGGK